MADKDSAWRDGILHNHPLRYDQTGGGLGDGILLNVDAFRVSDVFDGISQTLFVGKVTGGTDWVHGLIRSIGSGMNGVNTIPEKGIYIPSVGNPESGFSSYHLGGAHFLRVDSSVRFESENIDQAVLVALTTRAGGEVISSNDL